MTLCINPKCQRPENSDQTLFCQTCGSELLLDGRYRAQSELGYGGFGKTYEVLEAQQPQPLVLKVLINPMDKALELFKREAEVLGRLNHPGIPHVDEDGYFVFFPRSAEKPVHCLIMEKIEGLNLQDYMSQRGDRPVNQKVVLKWLIEIVEILNIVHIQNVFHRDIKPSNVMLRNDGRLALIDFGTAREVTGTYVAKQEARGVTGIISAGYTPIEQLNGQAVLQSDFYALGRTIAYLLTAKEPSDIYDAVTDEFPWRQYVPKIHPDFADFLDQMMARVPKYRPPNTRSILDSLRHLNQLIRTQDPVAKPVQSTPESSASPLTNPSLAAQFAYRLPVSTPGDSPQGNVLPFESGSQPGSPYSQPVGGSFSQHTELTTANFGLRAVAYIIDLCLLGVATVVLGVVIGLATQDNYIEGAGDAIATSTAFLILFIHPFMTWLYFAWMHSSKAQATFGKKMLGLKVVTVQGNKLSFGLATARFAGRLLSSLVLVGYFLAMFSQRRQALHDLMAQTLVVIKRP